MMTGGDDEARRAGMLCEDASVRRFVARFYTDDAYPSATRLRNNLTEFELPGEIHSWIETYLCYFDCPHFLRQRLIRRIFESSEFSSISFHLNGDGGIVEVGTLRLDVFRVINTLIERLFPRHSSLEGRPAAAEGDELIAFDDYWSMKYETIRIFSMDEEIIRTPVGSDVLFLSFKNRQRKNEDRCICVENTADVLCYKKNGSPPLLPQNASFYAVYDGHGGPDCANYCSKHLHFHFLLRNLSNNDTDTSIGEKLKKSILELDERFCDHARADGMRRVGSTLVCSFITEKSIHFAWVGDSQVALFRRDSLAFFNSPHKPQLELDRLKSLGASVSMKGSVWRVEDDLAVSRAIGDEYLKRFVTAEADVFSVRRSGDETFMVIASDGLWDVLTPENVCWLIYEYISSHCNSTSQLLEFLCQKCIALGQSDNITIIIVFFTKPQQLTQMPEFAQNIALDDGYPFD